MKYVEDLIYEAKVLDDDAVFVRRQTRIFRKRIAIFTQNEPAVAPTV